MTLANIIAIAVILVIVGCAVFYIIKEKKRGRHCIGCPDSASCASCRGNCPGCHSASENNK